MKRLSRPTRILLFIPLFALGIFVFGSIVMLLCNNVLTPVLHVSTISFWQGLGILVLSKILFSSFSGGGGSRRDYCKQRMMWNNMTTEQKEKFKEEWKNRSRRWGYKSWERTRETGDETQQPESQV
jgi:Ca2+/H+ antiporter, TMEM165/GDT1 family